MNQVYLGLGSNLNNPRRQLTFAVQALGSLPHTRLLRVAPFYANPAWGRKAQPGFYNTAVLLTTRLQPHLLLRMCQEIECRMGRVRRVKWGARIIDIDILYYADRVINHPRLTLPHPFIEQREFVKIPLSAIFQGHQSC